MESVEPGRLVAGRYWLGAVIGRGGMGVVWRARDELLGREVAVKELVWPTYFSGQERQAACRRAITEARLAARLSHRNVVRVFDIVEEDGCPWIVMELLAYRSLRDLIKEEGPLSPAAAAEVGLGILAALRAAHRAGIAHRDVKPANILMAPDRVVLTDFGIARAAGTSELTTTLGVLIGSPSYMSPERARGGGSGAPGDLWGLGASLYAAVEGHGPFDRGGVLASLTAVVADELESAVHAGPLWPVISGLLRKDPDERLDGAEAERMLRAAVTSLADPVVPATPVSTMAPRTRRQRRSQKSQRSQQSRGPAIALVGSAALAVIAASGTVLGLTLTSSPGPKAAAAGTSPATASAGTPAVSARPSTAAGTHPRTSAGTHLTARTTRTPASRAPGSRPAAHRAASATTSSRTGRLRNGTAPRGWRVVRIGRFVFYVPNLEWPSHPLQAGQPRHRRHRRLRAPWPREAGGAAGETTRPFGRLKDFDLPNGRVISRRTSRSLCHVPIAVALTRTSTQAGPGTLTAPGGSAGRVMVRSATVAACSRCRWAATSAAWRDSVAHGSAAGSTRDSSSDCQAQGRSPAGGGRNWTGTGPAPCR
jgi:serine/threonine protein kinase